MIGHRHHQNTKQHRRYRWRWRNGPWEWDCSQVKITRKKSSEVKEWKSRETKLQQLLLKENSAEIILRRWNEKAAAAAQQNNQQQKKVLRRDLTRWIRTRYDRNSKWPRETLGERTTLAFLREGDAASDLRTRRHSSRRREDASTRTH